MLNDQPRQIWTVTLWGLVANLLLSGLKLLFGILGSSQALVADAVHSVSDSVTDLAVLIGAPFWSAPPDAGHPHGHARIETMITFVIGVVLGSVGLGLGYRAVATLHQHHASTPGWLAFAAACLSIVAKEALFQWTVRVGRRIKSSALIANAWHHRTDALSSVPVALAVLATKIWPAWVFLDHIATVIVSLLILHASWKISWPALRQLVDAGAAAHEIDQIVQTAVGTPGVGEVHAIRTRYIGAGMQVDLHVLVDGGMNVHQGHEIAREVKRRLLHQVPDVVDVLVHIEPLPKTPAAPTGPPPLREG